MILVLDNYDSFTYNLVQYMGELGATMHVARNDALTVDDVDADRTQPFEPQIVHGVFVRRTLQSVQFLRNRQLLLAGDCLELCVGRAVIIDHLVSEIFDALILHFAFGDLARIHLEHAARSGLVEEILRAVGSEGNVRHVSVAGSYSSFAAKAPPLVMISPPISCARPASVPMTIVRRAVGIGARAVHVFVAGS